MFQDFCLDLGPQDTGSALHTVKALCQQADHCVLNLYLVCQGKCILLSEVFLATEKFAERGKKKVPRERLRKDILNSPHLFSCRGICVLV